MPTVLKSESLNLPETPGPVQACNGTALPLYGLILNGAQDRAVYVWEGESFANSNK